jgi:hypothetical protein
MAPDSLSITAKIRSDPSGRQPDGAASEKKHVFGFRLPLRDRLPRLPVGRSRIARNA